VRFPRPLVKGRLLRRYKRFLADVEIEDGTQVTAHTANPGAMTGICHPGSTVYLSRHDDPRRKLAFTWEIIVVGRCLVGVNPILSNRLAAESIARGAVRELCGYSTIRREVRLGGDGATRIDLLLQGPEREDCYVEVKSVTLMQGRLGLFPDATTRRGQRHLRELMALTRRGKRTALLFVVQRRDVERVAAAEAIDPEYARLLREAARAGVEILAYRAIVRTRGIRLAERLPFQQKGD
jgi:sugar fermentation stimulation protein A